MKIVIGSRHNGPVFLRRRLNSGKEQPALALDIDDLRIEAAERVETAEKADGDKFSRQQRHRLLQRVWVDLGAIEAERLRVDFMRLTAAIGVPAATAPKALRHLFATGMQEANIDPLVRSLLMGHAAAGSHAKGGALGMTTVYTHTQPATLRRQIETALHNRPALEVARRWIQSRAHPLENNASSD